ncbi:response regulator [Gordonia sp. (in: high G+C Gram-positive bacteria)]|uniref:response regulator n=1 Tax=Gordonia sp. (in: high G+C Gram-positive bacteria) TaxID=84139 RepID=UPI0016BC6940|nr:response regulator [Gordonia sp. (in: high G+C Gram-positive bacteria)]NLG46936.1 response regulator [Gordonia sp. (in: high G+C Gram-positive bacteria)]
MATGLRILIASPLGKVISGPLQAAFDDVTVSVATSDEELTRMISGTVRYDVVAADLIWNRPELEWRFDGLDVIDRLRDADRPAPVLLASQGHSMEIDHLEEARLRPEVFGVIPKSDGLNAIVDALRAAALGRRLRPTPAPVPTRIPLYELFGDRRGQTAGRLAGAIAAGNATDNASLARIAKVSPSTANKVTSHYLGPIMLARDEHDEDLPLSQGAVYRWCGLHARYLISWCRRNGHGDVLG